ncbi:MAG: lipid II flippase MurJ [Candidatus Paceibacterota bacterium]
MLALVRDRLLAHTFGAGGELDLYYAAFRIPDLMFALFASVLSVYVLLPFVTKAKEKGNLQAGSNVLSQIFSAFLVTYAISAVVVFIGAPYLVGLIFPGFGAEDSNMLVLLIRVLLLQPFLLGISSLFGVITQYSQRFILYAISPLVYNLGIILGIAVFYPIFGLIGLVLGVVVGALGHMLIQLPLVSRSELNFKLLTNIDWPLVKSVLVFAFPRAITLSIHQVVLLVFVSFATLMAAGSVSVFQFAFNLQSVPLAVVGMSYSVAAFPVLAELFAKQQRETFCIHLMSAFRHIIFWSMPIIALVIVLRAQIVRAILGSGSFSWNDTRLTAAMLAVLVVSLIAQSLMLLLVRAFYAGGNTRTPLLIALTGAFVSISSTVLLIAVYDSAPYVNQLVDSLFRLEGVQGTEVLLLGLTFIFGTIFEMVLLLIFSARLFGLNWFKLTRQVLQSLAAAVVSAIVAYITLNFIVDGVNQETLIGIILQGAVAGVFGIIGAILTYYVLGSKELHEIYTSFRSKILKTDVIAPQSEVL